MNTARPQRRTNADKLASRTKRAHLRLTKNPLLKFSLYSDEQVSFLRQESERIVLLLEASKQSGHLFAPEYYAAYWSFWLWTLGAFEVVRTICAAKGCFSEPVVSRMRRLKRRLVTLRVPFAKQQKAHGKGPIEAQPSIFGFGAESNDLLFELDGEVVSARDLMAEFERTFSELGLSDVLRRYR